MSGSSRLVHHSEELSPIVHDPGDGFNLIQQEKLARIVADVGIRLRRRMR